MLEATVAFMTDGASESGQLAQINRMLKRPALRRRECIPCFRLVQRRVTDSAVIPDDLPCAAHVLPIVATEAPLRIVVAYIIRVGLPVCSHLREEVGLVDALDFCDGPFD